MQCRVRGLHGCQDVWAGATWYVDRRPILSGTLRHVCGIVRSRSSAPGVCENVSDGVRARRSDLACSAWLQCDAGSIRARHPGRHTASPVARSTRALVWRVDSRHLPVVQKLCEMIDDIMHGRPVKAMQPPPPKQGGFPSSSPGAMLGGLPGGMQSPGLYPGAPAGSMGGPPMGGGGFMGSSYGGPVPGGAGYGAAAPGGWSAPGGGGMPTQGQFQQGQQYPGQFNQGQPVQGHFGGTQQYGAQYQGMHQHGMPQGMAQPNMAFIDQPSYGPR